MKIRLAVIGVESSITQAMRAFNKYKEIEIFPHVLEEATEIGQLLKTYDRDVDMWLFTEQLAYRTALHVSKTPHRLFCLSSTESSLLLTLSDLLVHKTISAGELSFDSYTRDELLSAFSELHVRDAPIHIVPDAGTYEEWANYHRSSWLEGTTKAAITGSAFVYNRLQQSAVPVFLLKPTEASIDNMAKLIIQAWEALRLTDAQIAVQIFEVAPPSSLIDGDLSTDYWLNMELSTTRKWHTYAKHVQGSVRNVNSGIVIIYTTRGMMSELTNHFSLIPDLPEIRGSDKEDLTCGIGIGITVHEAELAAGLALRHAREYGKGSWMVILEDKSITGPLGRTDQLTYSYSSSQLDKISNRSALSVSTLGKLDSILKKRGTDEINANELAQFMQILPRSARRILIQLETAGYAKVVGEEAPHPRGRPRKKYQIQLR
ncbi:hypothetical protein [Gorillibacterium massiliense]|uniref:hypothetical protein n=1 Tax=Gorillibacterium massiliense TaxID=1280390 RepID=UPI0004B9BCD0|nr:hypothetical protein [Gorillibacterium massiliense]